MYNKKGSPSRLGKPAPGQKRKPTSGESEFCGLRRSDLICVDEDGGITIMRSKSPCMNLGKRKISGYEAEDIIEDLEIYWSR